MHNWEALDIVLSGINFGSNLGNAMWHSGTLAGAKQAVLFGLRGIAFSAPTLRGDPDLSALESQWPLRSTSCCRHASSRS